VSGLSLVRVSARELLPSRLAPPSPLNASTASIFRFATTSYSPIRIIPLFSFSLRFDVLSEAARLVPAVPKRDWMQFLVFFLFLFVTPDAGTGFIQHASSLFR